MSLKARVSKLERTASEREVEKYGAWLRSLPDEVFTAWRESTISRLQEIGLDWPPAKNITGLIRTAEEAGRGDEAKRIVLDTWHEVAGQPPASEKARQI